MPAASPMKTTMAMVHRRCGLMFIFVNGLNGDGRDPTYDGNDGGNNRDCALGGYDDDTNRVQSNRVVSHDI